MVGPEGRAVCSWCTCDICIYLLYFSVSSSSITSFQGYEIGAVTMMQRKGSKQRCVMPRQASHLSLRKTENDIVNWGMDIWRAVPIFPYLTGLSKLNALSGTAGSDTVTLLILGEIISDLKGETNHVCFIPLHGELCEPHYDNRLIFHLEIFLRHRAELISSQTK
jgi:hypothetical protein